MRVLHERRRRFLDLCPHTMYDDARVDQRLHNRPINSNHCFSYNHFPRRSSNRLCHLHGLLHICIDRRLTVNNELYSRLLQQLLRCTHCYHWHIFLHVSGNTSCYHSLSNHSDHSGFNLYFIYHNGASDFSIVGFQREKRKE
jgi:hypothetical protein